MRQHGHWVCLQLFDRCTFLACEALFASAGKTGPPWQACAGWHLHCPLRDAAPDAGPEPLEPAACAFLGAPLALLRAAPPAAACAM